MAEQISRSHVENRNGEETREGGCFRFLTKGEEKKTEDDVVMADPNAAKECKGEKHTLMDELRHTHSHSTSVSFPSINDGSILVSCLLSEMHFVLSLATKKWKKGEERGKKRRRKRG